MQTQLVSVIEQQLEKRPTKKRSTFAIVEMMQNMVKKSNYRKDAEHLHALNDNQLQDIGIHRGDITDRVYGSNHGGRNA
jgi:uncharacterized protein YjiS (DUF1127 family)